MTKTGLKQRIVRMIEVDGPINVSAYMQLCLNDPDDGYYQTKEPFGAGGDFVTAPEISQLFGELLSAWLIQFWREKGSPVPFNLVEIGPGRATLMADLLRTARFLDPSFFQAARIAMVETSPRLMAQQQHNLTSAFAGIEDRLQWYTDFETVPQNFTILVANELFDALPVRQYVKHDDRFVERVIGVGENGKLVFLTGHGGLDPCLLPDGWRNRPNDTVFETSPAQAGLMGTIAGRLSAHGGAALVIDYGHAVPGFGDTLQALQDKGRADPLQHPGKADLTCHVDFSALAEAANAQGAFAHGVMEQGEFLLHLGIEKRAGVLGAGKSQTVQTEIIAAVDRLVGDKAMGKLFKVLCITGNPDAPLPFSQSHDHGGVDKTNQVRELLCR